MAPTADAAVGVDAPTAAVIRRPPFRIAIIVGIGLTFAVWLSAGVYFGRRVADLEEQANTCSRGYMRAQQLVTDARSRITLSTLYLRDALLDTSTTTPAAVRSNIELALDRASEDLAMYTPMMGENGPDGQRVGRLRQEIDALRQDMTGLLADTGPDWRMRTGRVLRERLTPRRAEIVKVADELGAINQTIFIDHQADINTIYESTQARIWQVFGLSLALSFGIGLLAALYAGRLEQRVGEQHVRDVNMRADLQRLSAKLIRVQEQERRALARELHDEIGQMLTAVKVELAVAQRAIDDHGGPVDVLDDARPIVDRALHAVRDLSHMLHPSVLDDLGLLAATERYVKGFQKRHGVTVEFVAEEMDDRLAPDVEIAAYRIVQEALTNVAKHARAASCRVSLVRQGTRLIVSIADDGVGFNVIGTGRFSMGSGLGLVSMRERAAQLGGGMYVTSQPGRGTNIVADLPAREPLVEPVVGASVPPPLAASAPAVQRVPEELA
jgi:signal transduction histidine kinase